MRHRHRTTDRPLLLSPVLESPTGRTADTPTPLDRHAADHTDRAGTFLQA